MILLIFVLGLVIGSFLAAYTYRLPKNISIAKGRSFCDTCHYQLNWFDNIPVVSYLFLRGKCRKCGKKISPRYLIIEVLTGASFAFLYFYSSQILINSSFLVFPLVLVLASTSIATAVIDIEYQVMPDELTFYPLGITILFFFVFGGSDLYLRLFVSFMCALFLLTLNLITKGKGMGLGDVKYALLPGFILGFPLSVVWFFVSFLLGAIWGIFLLIQKKVKLKQRIAFGPFLIVGFWIVIMYGQKLTHIVFPYF